MKCANQLCNAEGLYLRSGSLHELDFVVAGGQTADGETIRRKIVWLCAKCSRHFEVETWRPPGQQLQPRIRESAATRTVPTARMKREFAVARLAS